MTTTPWVYHAPYTVDFELVSQLIQSVYKYESGKNDNDIDMWYQIASMRVVWFLCSCQRQQQNKRRRECQSTTAAHRSLA